MVVLISVINMGIILLLMFLMLLGLVSSILVYWLNVGVLFGVLVLLVGVVLVIF